MIIDNIEMIVYKNHIYPIIEGMMLAANNQ